MKRHFLLLLVLAAGCSEGIIVTVEARPAVHDVAKLRVTLSGEGPPVIEDLAVDDDTFPKTFSIGPAERSGDLLIAIDALDASDIRVGLGSVTTSIDAPGASLLLEPTDFVVNTEYVGDQRLLQFAAATDGTWTVIYSSPTEEQGSAYDVLSRRYDFLGRPDGALANKLARVPAGDQIATASTTALVIRLDHTNEEIWCDASDVSGTSTALLAREDGSRPQIAARPDNTFVVVWRVRSPNDPFLDDVRAAIVDSKCKLVGGHPAMTIGSTSVFSPLAKAIARGGDVLYMWRDPDDAIRMRVAHQAGDAAQVLIGSGDTVIPPIPDVRNMITAVLDDGFGVLLESEGSTPRSYLLYRINNMGILTEPPLVFPTEWYIDSFGPVPGSDGNWVILGTDCSGVNCDAVARFRSSTGAPLGNTFPLATTTSGLQGSPLATVLPNGVMAAAWVDQSLELPDVSGYAVRARIIYPPTR